MSKKTQLAKGMEQCKSELFQLFEGQDLATESFLNNLRKIDKFYGLRFLANKASQDDVLREYQVLVSTFKHIKEGTVSSDEGLKIIKNFSFKRKMEVAVANVLNACALLFWMATAITSYAFCLGLAIPLIFFNPVVGVALTLGTSAVMLAATLKGAECVREFESFKAANKEEELERNTLSFFALKPNVQQEKALESELHEDLSQQSMACG